MLLMGLMKLVIHQALLLCSRSSNRIGFKYSYCTLTNNRLSENEHSLYNKIFITSYISIVYNYLFLRHTPCIKI